MNKYTIKFPINEFNDVGNVDGLYLQSGSNGSLALLPDFFVVSQIKFQKALIFLRNTTQKDMVSGATNQAQNTWKIDVEGSQQRL